MAVQEHDMDAVSLHKDTIIPGLKNMFATAQYALEDDVVDAADFGNRILLLLRGDTQTEMALSTIISNNVDTMDFDEIFDDICGNDGAYFVCYFFLVLPLLVILSPIIILYCLVQCSIQPDEGQDHPNMCAIKCPGFSP